MGHLLANLVYASTPQGHLLLDLYLPNEGVAPYPLTAWIHGGGWSQGAKEQPRALRTTREGYAVASISYRLGYQALWPAQLHDCKAAVR